MPGKENGVRPMIVGVAQERRISFHRNGVNISEALMSSPHDKSPACAPGSYRGTIEKKSAISMLMPDC
jgi:hypothetical protein